MSSPRRNRRRKSQPPKSTQEFSDDDIYGINTDELQDAANGDDYENDVNRKLEMQKKLQQGSPPGSPRRGKKNVANVLTGRISSPVTRRRPIRKPDKSAQEQFSDDDHIAGEHQDANGTGSGDENGRGSEDADYAIPKRERNQMSPKRGRESKVVGVDEVDSRIDKRRSSQYASQKRSVKEKTKGEITNFHSFLCISCLVAAGFAVMLLYGGPVTSKPAFYDKGKPAEDRQQEFSAKFDKLKSKFPNQNDRFWNVVAAAPMSHVFGYGEVNRPIVVLLASQPGAESTTKCIAKHIAEMYTMGLVGSLHDAVSINGSRYMTVDSDDTKREIDSKLSNGFDGYSRAAIVHRFDQLPACTALLFHSYCENDNAPYKNVAIILSVALDQSVAMDHKEVEQRVNDHLGKSWSSCPDFQEKGKIEAMLSRVANNIALVNSEEEYICND